MTLKCYIYTTNVVNFSIEEYNSKKGEIIYENNE